MTIRARLVATYVGLTALGTALLAGCLLWSFSGYFRRTTETELVTRASLLANAVGEALGKGDPARADSILRSQGSQEGIGVRLFGPDGSLLGSTDLNRDQSIRDWSRVPGVPEALSGTPSSGAAPGVHERVGRIYAAHPVRHGGKLLGAIRISVTIEHFRSQMRAAVATVLVTVALVLVLAVAMSLRLAGDIASPVSAMRDFAVEVGSGSFSGTLPEQRRDELGELAAELNRMSARLASLDQQRRVFLASVSHELRTPVTNLLVTLDALEQGADDDPELRARFMRIAADEASRLGRLIEDLLDLGRLESGVAPLDLQEVDAAGLIERVIRALEPRRLGRRLRVESRASAATVRADPERLLQAVMNIAENALKHAPTGSTLRFGCSEEGEQVSIYVSDEGPGISEVDLPHIFEQFYSADRSRKGPGTGLGLAIARRIVEAHGGGITVESEPGRGATFRIHLPAAHVSA